MCDKGLIWNPSNCECECGKSCAVEEYLNYEKCRKRLIDKLVEEYSEILMEMKWFITITKMYAILVEYTLYYLSLLFNDHWH